jgi:hypothetical protein
MPVSKISMMKVLDFVLRAFVTLMGVFWLFFTVLLIGQFVTHGLAGVQAKLMHIWLMSVPFEDRNCAALIEVVHRGYGGLILMLLVTWAAIELMRFVDRCSRSQ